MDPHEFIEVAVRLAAGTTQGDWRSAVSRAYYGAFHLGRQCLEAAGFAVPPGPQCHGYVWLRLANSGDPDLIASGNLLNTLRSRRNRADYDLTTSIAQAFAQTQVGVAQDIARVLDDLPNKPATLSAVVAAIRAYERDVLRDVTHRGP